MLTVDKYGLFIGEVSLPNQSGASFYEKNIATLFSGMLKSLSNTKSLDNKKENYCYLPTAYCMLGSYDLAVLSLIDDFHFGAKYFNPYSFLYDHKDAENKGFNHHISMGTYTYKSKDKATKNLVNRAKQTFLKDDDRYPFIGITNVKIKNSLVIGTGIDFVNVCVNALRIILREYSTEVKDFDFLIIEPISWNEITIIFFSNCFKKVADALFLVREMNVNYAIQQAKVSRLKISEDILYDTLLYKESKETPDRILKSHLFTHTFSNMGIDMSWLYEVNENEYEYLVNNFKRSSRPKKFENFTRWFIKPAYLTSFLTENKITGEFNWVIGNGDVEMKDEGILFPDLLKRLKKFLFEQTSAPMESMVRKTKSIPKFAYSKSDIEAISKFNLISAGSNTPDLSISDKLKLYAFDLIEVKAIRKNLIALKVSRPLRERILNAFINYDDCIKDPILYSTFIELRDYLKHLSKLIEDDSTNPVLSNQEDRHNRYNEIVNSFDQAYKSIIIHSYRLYNVTDFNLEYNGGIQTITSGYDSLFKYFRGRMHNSTTDSFKFPYISMVSSEKYIKTKMYSLFINYNHLFSPEFFLCALPKESVNDYFFNIGIDQNIKYDYKNIANLYKAEEFVRAEQEILAFNMSCDDKLELLHIALNIIHQAPNQIISIFKSRVLEEIRKPENNEHISVNLEYLDAIYKDLIFYFLEDTFASWVLSAERYAFWLLATFVQESTSYNKDGTFNERLLIRLLLRISFFKSDIDMEKFFVFHKTNLEQVKYHLPKVVEFLRVISVLDIVPGASLISLRGFMPPFNRQMHDLKNDTIEDASFETRKKEVEFIKRFKNGSIGDLKLDTSFSSIRGLINAYLDVVKGLYPAYPKSIVLYRNEDGHPDFDPHGNYKDRKIKNAIVLDPTGGNFTIGKEVRAKYFRIRSTLIKLLYHFSMKQKINLFDRN